MRKPIFNLIIVTMLSLLMACNLLEGQTATATPDPFGESVGRRGSTSRETPPSKPMVTPQTPTMEPRDLADNRANENEVRRHARVLTDKDSEASSRIEAIRSIQRIPSIASVEALKIAAIQDSELRIRVAAVHAIGQIGDETTIAILEGISNDSTDSEVRSAARANIYGLREEHPMSNPPKISMEAIKLESSDKPITVVTTITSPVDRDYASVKLVGSRVWKQIADSKSSRQQTQFQYEGPLSASKPVSLTHVIELSEDFVDREIVPLPLKVTTGNSKLDFTTYREFLYLDFSASPPTASMVPPPAFQPKEPREIRLNSERYSPQSKSNQSLTPDNDSTSWNVSFVPNGNTPMGNDLRYNKVVSTNLELITVEGTLSYIDGETVSSNPAAGNTPTLNNPFIAPAYNVKVTICGLDWWCSTGHTDLEGRYSINVLAQVGTVLKYKFRAENNAMMWYGDMDCQNEKFYFTTEKTVPPLGDQFDGSTFLDGGIVMGNHELVEKVGICWGNTMNIHFTPSGVMNLSTVMSLAYDDVMDNRDPSANDSLTTIDVVYCDPSWPHFDAFWHEIYLPCYKVNGNIPSGMQDWQNGAVDAGLVDRVITHEYYHHVQHDIASDGDAGGPHSGCTANTGSKGARLAFSEGTASYFAQHMLRNYPNMYITGANPENPCANSVGDFRTENFTIGTMWDLADGLGAGRDGWDTVDGNQIDGHRLIMEILDKELDSGAKNLGHFYTAWVNRTGESGRIALDSILSSHGIARTSGGLKNLPLPVVGPVPEIPESRSLFPTGKWGTTSALPEYHYQVNIEDETPLSIEIDFSYIGSTLLLEGTYTVQQKINGRFLDAHGNSGEDFSAVTRTAQNNDSQRWLLTHLGDNTYTIQQEENNRFLDAWDDGTNDYSAVTRTAQNNDSQRWILLPWGYGTYTIQQKNTGRVLDAWDNGTNDYSAVTRESLLDDSQKWILTPVNNSLSTRIGLSNLNVGNMPANGISGSELFANEGDFYIAVSPSSASQWLTISPTTGTFDPRTLTQLDLDIDPEQVGLTSQSKKANIEIVFEPDYIQVLNQDTTPVNPTDVNPTRKIKVTFNLVDGPNDDSDNDGMTNEKEISAASMTTFAGNQGWFGCLDPLDADSDNDGINDGDESNSLNAWMKASFSGTVTFTLPCNPDTDGDGIKDGFEVQHSDCMDPNTPDASEDPDGDGLTNLQEYTLEGVMQGDMAYGLFWTPTQTNPCVGDTDGDGTDDSSDNCATMSNADQANNDKDSWGDACDGDDDNDNCPDDGDNDPFDQADFLDCYKLPYATRVKMGFIDPIRDLLKIPNEDYMILKVGPKPFGDNWCGRIACPPPHVRIVDRAFSIIYEVSHNDLRLAQRSGFGSSATWVEDLDGDRIKDLVIGAPYAQAPRTKGNTGAILVLSGKTGEELGRITGSRQGGHFGQSLAALGSKLLAVGAPGAGLMERNPGTVSIIDLTTFSIIASYEKGTSGDQFGFSLFGIPDMDRDGKNELLIGAPKDSQVGALYLLKPGSGDLTRLAQGTGRNSLFGQTIASGGDITGDGVIDVLVGAPSASGTGSITLLNINGRQEWSLKGSERGDEFGSSIAAILGNNRQKTSSTFIVGAPGSNQDSGTAYIVSAKGKSEVFTVGDKAGSRVGDSVAVMSGIGRDSAPVLVVSQMDLGSGTKETLITDKAKVFR